MLLAWSITEVIRYSYFALSLSGYTPKPLVWLRYNTFFVLYPIGILSESYLIWAATEDAMHFNPLFAYGLYTILLIYIPGSSPSFRPSLYLLTWSGSYVLYTYMMAQRRKVLKGLKAKDESVSK